MNSFIKDLTDVNKDEDVLFWSNDVIKILNKLENRNKLFFISLNERNNVIKAFMCREDLDTIVNGNHV